VTTGGPATTAVTVILFGRGTTYRTSHSGRAERWR